MEHVAHAGPFGPYLDLSPTFPEGVYAYLLLKGNRGVDPETLAAFLGDLGHGVHRVHRVDQIHSGRVVSSEEAPCEADGIVLRTPGEAVRVVTADCVPLLLSSEDGQCIAAVHAGWKGTFARIAETAVREMGGERAEMRAFLGPAIGPCCYTVDEERHAAFREAFPHAVKACGIPRRLDLHAVNTAQLIHLGVSPSHIVRETRCTACTVALCSSYRREGERAGRMAAVIGIAR